MKAMYLSASRARLAGMSLSPYSRALLSSAAVDDKERSERLSAAAVQVATDFAAGFK